MTVHEGIANLLGEDPLVEGAEEEPRRLSTMGDSPDGWCPFVSEAVEGYLTAAGFTVEAVMVTTGIPFIAIHYVTLVDGLIVDLTARQLVPPEDRHAIPFPLILPIEEYCAYLGVTIERES